MITRGHGTTVLKIETVVPWYMNQCTNNDETWYNIHAMYARTKTFTNKDGSKRTYIQIVESVRENDRVRQKVLLNMGRVEDIQDGAIDRLIASLAKFSKKKWLMEQQ